MFLKTITLTIAIALFSCNQKTEKDNTGLLLALVQTQSLATANQSLTTERNSSFILNGSWNSFTGNGTTTSTTTTISAKTGSDGLVVSDSSSFGGFNSCGFIKEFSNTTGVYITQNPPNNGACFAGDTNKGLFFKVIYFADGARYWTCTIFSPQTTQALAVNVVDNTVKTNPGVSGCGGFAWSRLERR